MKKKKSGGGGANWMDTYGDMVTLLLCFFVLLYSISTISEENWKALVQTFNPDAILTETEIEGSKGPSSENGEEGIMPDEDQETQDAIDEAIEELYQALKSYAAQEGLENTLSVIKEGGKVFVTFYDTTFFDGDSYELRRESYPILDKVSSILEQAAWAIDEVQVQGHTAQAGDEPNPIPNDRRLAGNRSASVVIYIQQHTNPDVLNPGKLVSVGYGQWHPVGNNMTADGKAKNRRVEMIISGRDLDAVIPEDNFAHFEPEIS